MTAARSADEAGCNLCGSLNRRLLYPSTAITDALVPTAFACTNVGHGEHGDIVRCDECGLVYAHPLPDAALLERAYAETKDDRYLEEEQYRRLNFEPLVKIIGNPAAGDTLLDVGCHIGTFLGLARTAGWKVEGAEPSRWACEVARGRGLEVHCGSLAELKSTATFDVVTLWDVFEHFDDPMAELRRLYERVRPGGLLALTTIDIGSLFARILGRRWPWLMHMHLFYFTRSTLQRYLESVGFEAVSIRSCRRVVSLGYAAHKARTGLRLPIGWLSRRLEAGSLGRRAVGINLGDVVLATARRPR